LSLRNDKFASQTSAAFGGSERLTFYGGHPGSHAGGHQDRNDQALGFGELCLNEGVVIRVLAIPVAGWRATDRKRLRIGLANRHRAPSHGVGGAAAW
jgi:hypothetical protein